MTFVCVYASKCISKATSYYINCIYVYHEIIISTTPQPDRSEIRQIKRYSIIILHSNSCSCVQSLTQLLNRRAYEKLINEQTYSYICQSNLGTGRVIIDVTVRR